MIFGAHVIVYSQDADADRAFFSELLGMSSVDAGHGWLIFALPPSELAVKPAESPAGDELYFMCDDLHAEMAALSEKGVVFSPSRLSSPQRFTSRPRPASRRSI